MDCARAANRRIDDATPSLDRVPRPLTVRD
jgi:hypothetical protein